MTKLELEQIFIELGVSFNEGIQNDKNTNIYPRIVFWEYVWEPLTASGTEYNTNVIYQVSFFNNLPPRKSEIVELKRKLAEKEIFPYIEHEYVQKEKYWHSYFRIDILENIG